MVSPRATCGPGSYRGLLTRAPVHLPVCLSVRPSCLQFETALKASAKRAEDERRKAAVKERQDLERAMSEQVNQVGVTHTWVSVCPMFATHNRTLSTLVTPPGVGSLQPSRHAVGCLLCGRSLVTSLLCGSHTNLLCDV